MAVLAVPAAADTARVGFPITGAAWLAGTAALILLAFPHVRHSASAAAVAGVAAAGSLAVTVLYSGPADNRTALWWLAELAISALTIRLAVRRAPGRAAALGGTAMFAAITVLPLRLTLHAVPPATARGAVLGCVFCGLVAAGTAATALYPRYLDARRSRAVDEARRAQRLVLARDLHDFVAHDVGGMVVQAQAAQVSPDPEVVRAALKRIEDAGLRAMASMDRTVHLLHSDAPQPYGLGDLPALTERFAETSDARVTLTVEVRDPPPEVSATAYRLVVEALTNVRRHAPRATAVDVTIAKAPGPAVQVTVTNDGRTRPRKTRRSGRGLTGLAEGIGALDGEFAAGPTGDQGWKVEAVLPLSPDGASPP